MSDAPSKTPPNLVARTGIEPVRDIEQTPSIAPNQQLGLPYHFPRAEVTYQNRPQSSPIAARLTRNDLRDLIAICRREISYTGLSQDAGQRALELIEKLSLIHKHGWKS